VTPRGTRAGAAVGSFLAVAVALGNTALEGARASFPQVGAWLPRYDLSEGAREAHPLERPLQEISGLAFDGRGRLFAHDDELARVHQLDPATGRILRTIPIGVVGMRGDFEGIAIVGARFFLITATGGLVEFGEPEEGRRAQFRRVDTGLGALCETEGLAYDAATQSLLAPCKTTRGRALDDQIVIFAIPLATLAAPARPRFAVPWAALDNAGIKGGFHPSSIEVHPRSGSLFLASAQEEALVEIAADGRVLAARRLPARAHPQSEGIAFGPDLSLWIADEGAGGRGTLTRYRLPAPSASEPR
jgi:uncharacterized protein YjiK